MNSDQPYSQKPPITRAVRRAPPPVRGFTARIVADLARSTGYAPPELVARWPEIAGEELQSISRPGRISGGATQRTLEVHVTNGAAATRVNFLSGHLVERLGAFLGPGVVTHIKVLQTGGDAPLSDSAPRKGLGRFRTG